MYDGINSVMFHNPYLWTLYLVAVMSIVLETTANVFKILKTINICLVPPITLDTPSLYGREDLKEVKI